MARAWFPVKVGLPCNNVSKGISLTLNRWRSVILSWQSSPQRLQTSLCRKEYRGLGEQETARTTRPPARIWPRVQNEISRFTREATGSSPAGISVDSQ